MVSTVSSNHSKGNSHSNSLNLRQGSPAANTRIRHRTLDSLQVLQASMENGPAPGTPPTRLATGTATVTVMVSAPARALQPRPLARLQQETRHPLQSLQRPARALFGITKARLPGEGRVAANDLWKSRAHRQRPPRALDFGKRSESDFLLNSLSEKKNRPGARASNFFCSRRFTLHAREKVVLVVDCQGLMRDRACSSSPRYGMPRPSWRASFCSCGSVP